VLGERLSCLLEQLLYVSPRQAERADDGIEIEIGVAEAAPDLSDNRPQPCRLHPTPPNDLCGFGRRPERCGNEIDEMDADDRRQFCWRGFFEGGERAQVAVEEAERRSRTHGTTCEVLRMGHQGFECGSPH